MKILMVCAEFAPWAKTGGLADAVAGLSDALSARGHDVRVLLPRYEHLPAPRGTRHIVAGVGGPFQLTEIEPDQEAEHAGRRRARPRVYLVELGDLTGDYIYMGDARDAGRFLRLSAAAAAFGAAKGWRPDVLHCHDWHTALVPVFQRLPPRSSARSVLTLHNVGYQGIFAASVFAEQGFAALERFRPHIIVSDIGMPDEDGFSFMARVRKLDRSAGGAIPSIALTAYTRSEDRGKALAAGYTTHLGKPVSPDDLLTAVASLAPLLVLQLCGLRLTRLLSWPAVAAILSTVGAATGFLLLLAGL